MIWYWLTLLGDWFLRLFFIPVKPRDVARISQNANCPVCGYKEGTLRTVVLNIIKPGTQVKPSPTVFCQHTCGVCGARWYEQPVVEMKPGQVWRSVARNEHEKAEDSYWASHEGGAYIAVTKQEEKAS